MKKILFVAFIAAFVLSACGRVAARRASDVQYYNAGMGGAAPAEPAYELPPQQPSSVTEEQAKANQDSSGGAAATTVERLVIQNAELSIVVADPKVRMDEMTALAKEMGGYVVSSNLRQTYASSGKMVPQADIVIRVPSEKLDGALDAVKKDAVEVQSEARSGQDVTAEYVDLKSRLKTYEDALTQLEKIMETNTTSEEVVNIFNQMTYYREQIELIKGQMKYYEEASAMSAITIHLIAEATTQPIEIGGWKPQGVAREAIQNLIYFWQDFVDFLITFFLYTLPVLITIGIPFYLVFLALRWIFRKLRGKKPATPESSAK